MSIPSIDSLPINNIKKRLLDKYELNVRSVSQIECSFERALSICLFDNEDEVDSIASTLHSQNDWSFDNPSDSHISYIMTAVRIYGITIYIHENNCEKIYQTDDDCPIVHLLKTELKDGSNIYLPTGNEDNIKKRKKEDEGESSDKFNTSDKFKTICSLSVSIRRIQADGNCYFRALSDQICGSEEGHVVLRALVIDFMSARRETFELCIDLEHFSSWDNFIWKMSQQGTFVDGNVVVGTAMLLRREIIIHRHAQRPILFKSLFPISNNNQIHLVHDSETCHYSSLWSIDGHKLHLDESECASA